MSLSIFSLNLWNLNGDVAARMRTADDYVALRWPDLLCLQEVSPLPGVGRPQSDLVGTQIAGLARFYSSQTQWDDREEGLSTLSRLPVLSFDSMILPVAPGDRQRRIQIAAVDVSGKTVLVANTHLAFRHEQDPERIVQCETLLRHLEAAAARHGTDAIVLVGDFNATPESGAVATLLRSELGLKDLFADTKERESQFTYVTDSPFTEQDADSRWIDYVFATESLTATSRKLGLNGAETGGFASDHVALEVTFDL